jgi:hypothetical protein
MKTLLASLAMTLVLAADADAARGSIVVRGRGNVVQVGGAAAVQGRVGAVGRVGFGGAAVVGRNGFVGAVGFNRGIGFNSFGYGNGFNRGFGGSFGYGGFGSNFGYAGLGYGGYSSAAYLPAFGMFAPPALNAASYSTSTVGYSAFSAPQMQVTSQVTETTTDPQTGQSISRTTTTFGLVR